ncbi:Gluconolactonase [Geodia barretti]|uniref:Gluconolactonase n=1 Tax=Geodia barretti TaxID=519541 RepID=A0AA35RUG8_GEOBA|nr:Gluconolactonase [Geodia barretti]
MTFDSQGRVVICEMVKPASDADGGGRSYTVIADSSEGKRPEPLRTMWCSSRTAACSSRTPGRDRLEPADVDLQFNSVHRIRPNGEVELVVPFEYPNGIAFSPYESVLYVANTRPGQYIMAYELNADGDVVGMRHFADMPSEHANNGVPDGMKVDVEGRVYCTGPGGCWVFESSGELIGVIELPEYPANCGWGGEENRTMYFTSNTSIYSLQMTTPGTRIPVVV